MNWFRKHIRMAFNGYAGAILAAIIGVILTLYVMAKIPAEVNHGNKQDQQSIVFNLFHLEYKSSSK